MAASNPDTLSDPNATLFNMSCFDLLLIELVPLAERMARSYEASLDRPSATSISTSTTAAAGRRGTTTTTPGAGSGTGTSGVKTPLNDAATPTSNTPGTNSGSPGSGIGNLTINHNPNSGVNGASGPASAAGGTNNPPAVTALAADGLPETEIFRDSVYVRLERLGFRVGQGLCERFSRDRPRFTDQLDVIKFICKDIWTVVFKKQIDNLKTNHRVCGFTSPFLYFSFSPIISNAAQKEASADASTLLLRAFSFSPIPSFAHSQG